MEKKIKYAIIFLSITVVIVVIAVFLMLKPKEKVEAEIPNEIEPPQENLVESENILVVEMAENTDELPEEPEEPIEPEPEEPEPQPPTPAEATKAIYDLKMDVGTLYIPKTNLNTPIYSEQTTKKMEEMPCFLYSAQGLNKPGVTLITGHNRRNGKLFSNNKKLEVGDIFYFKDYDGLELKYTITDKFITDKSDTKFLNTETDVPIMALSCCTDANNDDRIIILGRAEV